MQTPDKSETVAPPPWAAKARSVARWMLYAAGILILLAFGVSLIVLAFGMVRRTPGLIQYLLLSCGLGGVALGLLSLLIRFIVLAFGYHRFSIKGMLLLILCLGTGGAFLANGMLIGLGFLLLGPIVVISILWYKDNQADK